MPGQAVSNSQQFGGMPGHMNQEGLSVSGGMPGRPGMPPGPGSGPISSPMQQPPKRIDPDQMPNPVSLNYYHCNLKSNISFVLNFATTHLHLCHQVL